MLRGQFNHTFDKKFRIILPVQYRKELGSECVISKSYDKTLGLYSKANWEEFEKKLAAIPDSQSPNVRAAKRFFLGSAIDIDYDNNGRVFIPAHLREFADLSEDREVVFVGVGDHIEIWDSARFNNTMEETSEDIDEVIKNLSELGFMF